MKEKKEKQTGPGDKHAEHTQKWTWDWMTLTHPSSPAITASVSECGTNTTYSSSDNLPSY